MFRWQTSEHSLARLVDSREIRGVLGQDAVIHPNEAVVIIDDGKISDVLTQTRLEKAGGGLMNAMRRWFDTGRETEFLFLDTTEKVLNFPSERDDTAINLRNADHDDIEVVANMVFIADGRRAAQLYGLTRQQPTRDLSTQDLRRRIWDELLARVLGSSVRQYTSSQLGDISVINDLEAATRTELAKTLESWGVNLLRFTTRFGPSAWEEMRQRARELELETERTIVEMDAQEAVAEREHAAGMRADERGFESDLHGVKHDTVIRTEQMKGDISVRDMEREAEGRDAVETTETKVRVQDLEFEQDIREIDGLIAQKAKMDEVKARRLEKEARIRAMEFQETELRSKEVDADVSKHSATMDAEKSKYSMETYERALDRSDERTRVQMEMFAKTVEAAKPAVPHTYVGGDAPKGTYVDIAAGGEPSPKPPQESEEESRSCSECGAQASSTAKFCPGCGRKMDRA